MSMRHVRLGVAVALLGSSAAAHDLPLDTAMNAFVAVERDQLDLVLRVPLDLLHAIPFPVRGHEYDLPAAGPTTQQALAALADGVAIWEGGERLRRASAAGRFSLPSDRSFEDRGRAIAHIAEPPEPGARVYYDQGYFDAHFTYPISSPRSTFSIQTTVAPDLKDFAKLSVRYAPLGGEGRAFLITTQSGRVPLNPAWYQAAGSFAALGMEHILSGADHLLFLCCLVIPFRRLRSLVPVVTAFTLAHSLTLVGSAYHLAPAGAWFPPLVETAIAASIVYMALENIAGGDLRRRWLVTGLFGLAHGFGFSYGLQHQLQFAGSHLLVSLFSFNLGIEVGQLLVLAAAAPLLALLRRVISPRMGVIILSALVAHTGWHWMLERGQLLWQAEWPRPDAASIAVLASWVVGVLVAATAARFVARWAARRSPKRAPSESSTA